MQLVRLLCQHTHCEQALKRNQWTRRLPVKGGFHVPTEDPDCIWGLDLLRVGHGIRGPAG